MKKIVFSISLFFSASFISHSQNFSWAYGWGGDSYDHGYSVATDDSGYTYTVGMFQGEVDFDQGPNVFMLTSQNSDGFIVKTSPTGRLMWAQKIGGSGTDVANAVAVGANQDIYITGSFEGTVDFDNGTGNTSLTSPSHGYVLRLHANGNFVSVKQTGAPGKSISIDHNNNIFTGGTFIGTQDFDPGTGVFNLNSGTYSAMFLNKLNANGDFQWAKSYPVATDSNTVWCQATITDNQGNLYVTGGFDSTIDFNPGIGNAILTAQNFDAYFMKLAPNGDLIWIKHLEQTNLNIPYGDGFTVGNSIVLDANKNVHLTGVFSGVIDFDPSAGVDTINSGEWNPTFNYYYANMYIAKYDSSGNYIWAKGIISNHDVNGSDIALTPNGDIYATGYFSGTVDFDPSSDTAMAYNHNGMAIGHDIFVAKYDANGNYLWHHAIGGDMHDRGYSIALDNADNAYVTGIYEKLVDFDPGAGVWNLTTNFLESEKHNAFLMKFSECMPSKDTLDVNTCDSEYLWNANQYTYHAPGLYTHVLPSVNGCDSLVTLDLNMPIFANQPTYSGNTHTLIANPNQPAESYQWYDCNMPEVIAGANQATFLPQHNADYALIITNQGCTDTSQCLAVLNMNVNELDVHNIQLYPNPIHDMLNIQFTNLSSVSVQVLDVSGKLIQQENNIKSGTAIFSEEWKPGIYFVKVMRESASKTYKIIKQ